VWERALDGRTLQFRLIGINNQNFLMEDLETGSWWQQVSGAAVSGPLTGRRLTPVLHDEVTFGLWRAEHPATRVLGLDAEASQIKDTWEATTATARVVTPVRADDPLPPRTLVLGVVIDGEARAYPRETLRGSRVILDELHGVPIALLEAEDKHSVRVFSRRLDGATVDLLYKVDSTPARFIDEHTGSEFDFTGRGVSGPLSGRQLARVPHLSDYWFDWHEYHPDTSIYAPWQPRAVTP
jgi:Protein of unknown function (DUF3179)